MYIWSNIYLFAFGISRRFDKFWWRWAIISAKQIASNSLRFKPRSVNWDFAYYFIIHEVLCRFIFIAYSIRWDCSIFWVFDDRLHRSTEVQLCDMNECSADLQNNNIENNPLHINYIYILIMRNAMAFYSLFAMASSSILDVEPWYRPFVQMCFPALVKCYMLLWRSNILCCCRYARKTIHQRQIFSFIIMCICLRASIYSYI